MLLTLDSHDVIVVSVILTLSNTVWLASLALSAHLLSFGAMAGCTVALAASYIYLKNGQPGDELAGESFRLRRFAGITTSLLAAIVVAHSFQSSRETQYPPSVSQLFRFEAAHPSCHPRTRPASLRPLWQSDYHNFDSVLLIVFFSHARYDVNLDFYKQVYSKYFPNVVFLGPANREDAGFGHSFDVVVNSYQSDEDVSLDDRGMPKKMSGRMAHHMLYQAMSENDCGYDGYLWAPFDTFLNVPRLQLFDQSRFWYHSPWAHFVPNPAVAADKHAPPASVSPDPYPANPEDRYREPWCRRSKEYGLGVCVPAFEKVPLHLRKGLAEYTAGETRMVGGSTDTMYIPSKHAKAFRDTLGIFLETPCFLEIATPTTMHLVAPKSEPILFVDHYWIWYEPLNTSFVTQKWAEGFEVDTFHTFHWGDRDADGVWRAHPNSVEDVRRVLAESARRQGIQWG
ncbi:hypothetical protein FB45DRAFT_38832 [Roridomyces roridus]|uniref:Uncharacterized protein n=1 Tax=Roridomyces roridus TaxID=1738132 RepID=A0AAD7BR34_9AGAR|nr:hypothetical protein FB45DRAFT_38832 [Roridomyces roridus]